MKRILFTYVLLCLTGAFGVVMGQVPVITSDPKDTTVCFANRGNVVLTITASNNPTSYTWQQWYVGGPPSWMDITQDEEGYTGLNTPTLTVNTIYNWRLYYRCIATNAYGSSAPSAQAYLNAAESPRAAIFSGPSSVCQGATGIVYYAGLNLENTYTWSYSGSGATLHHVSGDSIIAIDFDGSAISGTLSLTNSGACGGVGPATQVIAINPMQATVAEAVGTGTICTSSYVASTSTTYSDPSNCSPICQITPSGGKPVKGTIQNCITVDAFVQSYAGIPYVQRHYNIEPSLYATTSTATLTLYFTQDDFDAYNLAKGINPALPTGSADATGIANLRVTQFHGTGTDPGTYVGGSGEIDPDDNNIVWNAAANRWEVTFDITGFSGFFISTGSLTPLPLTLLSFTGQSVTGGNLLQWTTSYEENTRSFEIQRNEGNGFQVVATLPAAGNSHQNQSYSYTDPLDGSAAYSYRLKMIDVDGKFTYSKTVTMQTSLTALSIGVSPNPFHQAVALTVTSPKPTNAVMTVTDISGKQLLQQNISLSKGENSLDPARIAALPNGMYLLSVTTDQQKQTVKFIKE